MKNPEYIGVDEQFIPEEERYVQNTNEGTNKVVSDLNNFLGDDEKRKQLYTRVSRTGKRIGVAYLGFTFIMLMLAIFMIVFGVIFMMKQMDKSDKRMEEMEQVTAHMMDVDEMKDNQTQMMEEMAEQQQEMLDNMTK